MSLLDLLSNPESWERFYEYRTSLVAKRAGTRELREFMDSRSYLAVCDEIVSRHGGTLTVANAPEGGCLVTVTLPMAKNA